MKRCSIHLDNTPEGISPKQFKSFEVEGMLRPAEFSVPFTGEKYQPVTKEQAKLGARTRVYADGIFDLFHFGHARALMQAKTAFPNVELVVGICSDELTQRLKGNTVMTEEERYDSVRHCRYVDEVVMDAPWVVTPDFMERFRIDFVAHDSAAYGAPGTEDIYKEVKAQGRFISTERTDGISTSDLIARIVKDYDIYIRRNLSRGYTAKQLNLGFVKRQQVRIKNKFGRIKKRSIDFFHKCENRSMNFLVGFVALFGRDGRMGEIFNHQRKRLARTLSPPLGFRSLQQDIETPVEEQKLST